MIVKKRLTFLIFGLLLLLTSCNEKQNDFIGNEINNSSSQSVISSETATMIARGVLCFEHNDLRDRKVFVTESPEAWHIQFIRTKNLESEGGDPTLVVSKKNGEIISGVLGK